MSRLYLLYRGVGDGTEEGSHAGRWGQVVNPAMRVDPCPAECDTEHARSVSRSRSGYTCACRVVYSPS